MKSAITVVIALLYIAGIIIGAFIGTYWWIVVRRWANRMMNQVQPYDGGNGMGSNRSNRMMGSGKM